MSNHSIIVIAISIICVLMSSLLWYIFGKDIKFEIVKNSKLTNSINALDISLIDNGVATDEDCFFLLLDLANRGYIKIIENANNDYTLIRLKEYDGKNKKESSFIKALFKHSFSVSLTEYVNAIAEGRTNESKDIDKEVKNSELYHNFQRASRNVLSIINTNEDKKKYFEDKSDRKKNYLIFMIAFILVMLTSLPFVEINKLYLLPLSVIFSIVILFILVTYVNNIDLKQNNSKVLSLILIGLLALIILLFPSFKRNRVYLIAFLISCISVAIILFFYKYMPRRTELGAKSYAKIEGYKLFLEELTNDELDKILSKNENYLYDTLPFAYQLGKEGIILKKIKEYNIKSPKWFVLKEDFTVQKFYNAMIRLKQILKKKEEI